MSRLGKHVSPEDHVVRNPHALAEGVDFSVYR